MKEYMLIFRNKLQENNAQPTAEQMQAMLSQWQSWIKGIAAKGNYSGTNRLTTEGKVLSSSNVVKDGPFAEAKEVVGGYLVVKTGSLESAVDIAKECPIFNYGGEVEVRSVLPINYDVNSESFLAGLQ
jgi:hypothetical protein